MAGKVIVGNALHTLGQLEPGSVQTVVTSPPYWGLRDYGDPGQEWPAVEFQLSLGGLDVPVAVPAMTAPLGLEEAPIAYVAHLVVIFREARRVLADSGTLWINIGDTWAGSGSTAGHHQRFENSTINGTRHQRANTRPAVPATKIGLKPKDKAGIPGMVAMSLRSDGWYWRDEIIWHKRSCYPASVKDRCTINHEYLFMLSKSARYYYDHQSNQVPATTGGTRNRRTVWTLSLQPSPYEHGALMPPKLVQPCIMVGSRPGDVVLDPFAGACTVGMVAEQLGREFVGIELSEEYAQLGRERMVRNREKLGTLTVEDAEILGKSAQLGLWGG